MRYLFLVILIGALGVGIVVLAWMGLAEWRRRRLLARLAHRVGLRYSPSDPFDLTLPHSPFVLASAGHSPRAENVLYGRCEGWYLRAFDYSFEAGHGPRRLTRRYGVIRADTNLRLPAALLWHVNDMEHAPLAASRPLGRVKDWLVVAGAEVAPALAEAFGDLAAAPVDVQTYGGCVVLCSAGRVRPRELADRLQRAVAGLHVLRRRCPA